MRDQKDWLEAEEDSKARVATYEADTVARTDIANNTACIAVELANLNANLCAIGYLLCLNLMEEQINGFRTQLDEMTSSRDHWKRAFFSALIRKA